MKDFDIKIEQIETEKLVNYALNAKLHPQEQVEQIAASIKQFGFLNPVIVDKDNTVIAGNGRLMAARKLGLKTVPAILVGHLTDIEKKAFIIADNKIQQNTGFDMDLLRVELEAIRTSGFEIGTIGFTTLEMKNIFNPRGKKEEDEDKLSKILEDVEKGTIERLVKKGDLWELGDHRLYCGDSTSPESYKILMNGDRADMLLTDPPYNVAYVGKSKAEGSADMVIENDSMSGDDFREFLFNFYKCAVDVTKEGGAIYVCHADSEGYNFRGAMIDAGWLLKQCLVWVKQTMVMGRQDYHWKHEPILYGWKPGAGHHWYTDRKQTTVLEFNRPQRSLIHPTTKPTDLFEYMIKNSSKDGDIVLDCFSGSGTTIIASENTGRRGFGLELDPKYASAIVLRWQELTGLTAKKMN